MAKKSKTDNDILAEIAEMTGGETLREAGQVPYYIDSGNLSLNFQMSGRFIGGGFPGGRIIEALGPEASGKSLLGYCFLGSVQRMDGIAIHLDCERSAGADFAERCGHVDPDRSLTYYPITLEQVEKKVYSVVSAIRKRFPDKPIGIVWDSIGVNPTDREWGETELPENPTKEQIKEAGGNERPGERAKVANSVLRKLNPFLSENNATIYVINQVRKKIGVLFGDPETTSGGGEALKFYASIRLRCGAPKQFQDKKTKFPLGVNMSVKNKKNRHFTPGLKMENIPLFFDNGIHPTGGLLDALIMSGRIEAAAKGSYTVLPEWQSDDGGEPTFKSSKAAPLSPEVLYRFPKLVDAKSAQEVKDYLNEWIKAIAMSASENLEEINNEDVEHLLGPDVSGNDVSGDDDE